MSRRNIILIFMLVCYSYSLYSSLSSINYTDLKDSGSQSTDFIGHNERLMISYLRQRSDERKIDARIKELDKETETKKTKAEKKDHAQKINTERIKLNQTKRKAEQYLLKSKVSHWLYNRVRPQRDLLIKTELSLKRPIPANIAEFFSTAMPVYTDRGAMANLVNNFDALIITPLSDATKDSLLALLFSSSEDKNSMRDKALNLNRYLMRCEEWASIKITIPLLPTGSSVPVVRNIIESIRPLRIMIHTTKQLYKTFEQKDALLKDSHNILSVAQADLRALKERFYKIMAEKITAARMSALGDQSIRTYMNQITEFKTLANIKKAEDLDLSQKAGLSVGIEQHAQDTLKQLESTPVARRPRPEGSDTPVATTLVVDTVQSNLKNLSRALMDLSS